MPDLPLARPEEAGLDPVRWQYACDQLQRWVKEDKLPAAALCVGRKGKLLEPRYFGRQQPEADALPLRKDALFLIASITKPVTVTAVLMLVERGELTLEDRVAAIVPRFKGHGKEDIQVRHLMTHTSGLPDMLADNEKMRKAHQPFAAFVDAVCKERLLFPPGTKVSYQSMGTAMLGEIV
jgi:CubicO group peptidase (beta-lactamase class C family)